MLKTKDRTVIKSFKDFVKSHNLELTVACIDDGKAQFKQHGYKVNNFFFTLYNRTLGIYMYDENDEWIVK